MKVRRSISWALVAATLATPSLTHACTSILVTRGASKDGSVLVTYSADAPFMPRLLRVGRRRASERDDGRRQGLGERPDPGADPSGRSDLHRRRPDEREPGLAGRDTTGGRRELVDRKGLLDYDALMFLTLQRAKSARDAIQIIDQLANEHGYGSSGETFSIADKDEAWLMELIGKGPGQKGIVWVAARVPDGSITAHANLARITTFPLDDPRTGSTPRTSSRSPSRRASTRPTPPSRSATGMPTTPTSGRRRNAVVPAGSGASIAGRARARTSPTPGSGD